MTTDQRLRWKEISAQTKTKTKTKNKNKINNKTKVTQKKEEGKEPDVDA
jgi:hypothetical protein